MNLKKVTQKNADGSSISYEFDVPKMQGVPDHPGEPKGTDTVPAWLTPGEFVMNAEATRMFEPQIEAMNDAGRAVQRQQGGTIPEYKADGGTVTDYNIPADYSGNINDLIYSTISNPSEQSYTYKPGQTEDRNQNIYNFAYEGLLDLDTVPNATPFDKSIIMQAMKDSQSKPKAVNSNVTLEDLTNRIEVPQAEMPGPTQAPDLGFYGQVPPAINPDYIQDNADVTSELLGERYSDPSRQQPAIPSNIVDAMASVPNPDDLSPMDVPRSFEDNGIGNPFPSVVDFMKSGNTQDITNKQRNADRDVPRSFEDNGISMSSALDYLNNTLSNAINVEKGIQTNKDNFNAIGNALSGAVDFMKSGNTQDITNKQRNADRQGVTISPSGQEEVLLNKAKERYINGDITKDEYDRLATNIRDSVLLNDSNQQTILTDRKNDVEARIERGKDVNADTSNLENELKDINSDIENVKGDTSLDKGIEQANAVSKVINDTEDQSNPGTDDVSTGKVIKTGEETMKTDPDMWDKAKSFIGDAFDEILDTKSLTQAAMLYLGSRALGYSHAGSINFVGKNYAQQIGNKLKVADKASLSNKYTKDSIEKYRKSGDLKDLELAKNIQKLETVDMVDKATGKTVTVTKFEDKNTDKVYFLDSNMKPVDKSKLRSLGDQTAYDTKMQGRVSDNFKAEVKRASRGDDDVLNELNFKLPNDQAFGQALVRQANKMGLDSNTINNVAPRIVRDMIRDLEQDRNLTLNETAIMPYINKQLVSFSVKDDTLKQQLSDASTEVVEKLSQSISSDPAKLNSEWKRYSQEFAKLKEENPKSYNEYVRRSKESKGFTPLTVYVTEMRNKGK